jgi:hypothetical protein
VYQQSYINSGTCTFAFEFPCPVLLHFSIHPFPLAFLATTSTFPWLDLSDFQLFDYKYSHYIQALTAKVQNLATDTIIQYTRSRTLYRHLSIASIGYHP